MDGPRVLGQDLALGLKACIHVPELRGQHEATIRLNAARVGLVGLRSGRAREQRIN